jgi:hypothetical protein
MKFTISSLVERGTTGTLHPVRVNRRAAEMCLVETRIAFTWIRPLVFQRLRFVWEAFTVDRLVWQLGRKANADRSDCWNVRQLRPMKLTSAGRSLILNSLRFHGVAISTSLSHRQP